MPPEILTSDELAARLKVNPETIRRQTRAGRLPFLRLGGEYRYDWDAVVASVSQKAESILIPVALLERLAFPAPDETGVTAWHGKPAFEAAIELREILRRCQGGAQ